MLIAFLGVFANFTVVNFGFSNNLHKCKLKSRAQNSRFSSPTPYFKT